MSEMVKFDWRRQARTGLPEVVFGEGKTTAQLMDICMGAMERKQRILMTRVSADRATLLLDRWPDGVAWNESARTIVVDVDGTGMELPESPVVGIVSAGTSDYALVAEIEQCLRFLGVQSRSYMDVGVAGLWRLIDVAEELDAHPILIAVAGMEGALFSVLAGLVKGPVIAVPSSVGYGVSAGGHAALNCALSSCAPGIAVVNIDNGFGAAALAVKMLAVHTTAV